MIRSELIGESYEVDLDVCQFLGHSLPRFLIEVSRLLLGKPLEALHEFAGLDRQSHRQVLGGVKLLPVAIFRKGAQLSLEGM